MSGLTAAVELFSVVLLYSFFKGAMESRFVHSEPEYGYVHTEVKRQGKARQFYLYSAFHTQ